MPTRTTTPEQKSDAARLRALFDAWVEREAVQTGQRPTQESVAAALNVGQSTVSQRLAGRLAMNRDFAAAMAKMLGCKVEDFSPTLAGEIEQLAESQMSAIDDFALVRRADVSVSAGHGALVFEEGSKSALTFRRSFLHEIGVTPASAVIVTVKGRSMEPTIRDGAVILVSTSAKTVIDREIYAFRLDDELFVKRLVNAGDAVKLVSDNPDKEMYPDRLIHELDDGIEIIGRALWMGTRL